MAKEIIEIWHNPRCSKSRESLKLLKENNIEPLITDYLKTSPSETDILELLKLLRLEPREIMRTNEKIYKELNLKNEHDNNALIQAMCQNPSLIERPIVIKGNKAVIGRPIENVIKLLDLPI